MGGSASLPYFVSHGYSVDFVSPTGGKVPFSMDPMGISSYAFKYEDFNGKIEASLTPDQVDYKNYKAVFIGGGYGPLFNVADNEDMLEIITNIYMKLAESLGDADMALVLLPMSN